MPFAAIAQGRNRLVFGEIGVWRIAAGALLWVALIALHPLVFAADPWRYMH